MVHEIATNAAVALQFGGNEHLCADAVGRSDKRARGVARKAKEPGEAAHGVELIGVTRFGEDGAVARHGLIARADVHAGFGITV